MKSLESIDMLRNTQKFWKQERTRTESFFFSQALLHTFQLLFQLMLEVHTCAIHHIDR